MDPVTFSMLLSVLVLLRISTTIPFSASNAFSVTARFLMRGAVKVRMFGGIWWALIGAPLAAYFVVLFFFSSTYTLNFQTVLTSLQTFSGPGLPYVLLFLILWAVFATGYFGAAKIYKRNGSK